MSKLLVVIVAAMFLIGCAGPMEIDQSGTSGGSSIGQPGGDVVNISIIVEKKEGVTEALSILGDVANIIPSLSGKVTNVPNLPAAPVAPTPAVEPVEDVVPLAPQGQVEEVE